MAPSRRDEPPDRLLIRPLAATDSVDHLTSLVRAAYAPHAARGLRYWGTHQTAADTAQRLASGHALVAVCGGELVGTLTVRPPQADSPVAVYRLPRTWSICQFAVAPAFKGRRVGKALHEAAVAHVLQRGGDTLALDTAAPAAALIEKYRGWGYAVVGGCDWRPHTNYLSVVMSLCLLDRAA